MADSSKANVYSMTQDQCCDNGHQARSNNHFSNDQVSDDLNNSKNSFASNGVNSMQEFNVDVNSKRSEHGLDVVILQEFSVEANSPPAVKVLTTNKQTAASSSSSDLVVGSIKILDSDNLNVNKGVDSNNILADMTVISHQNSSENIREIIANSDQNNKIQSDSEIVRVVNKINGGKNSVPEESVNKLDNKPEDPIERLNKLRASISNALSEVKGVLKQYSVDQSGEGENEAASSGKPTDDGPVRFRFVRKIRRKSVFSEDEDNDVPQNGENRQKIKMETTPTGHPQLVNNVEENSNSEANKTSVESSCNGEQKGGSSDQQAIKIEATISGPHVKPVLTRKDEQNEMGNKSDKNKLQSSEHNIVEVIKDVQEESQRRQDASIPGPVSNTVANLNHPKVIKKNNKAKALDKIKQTETSTVVNKPTKRNSIKSALNDKFCISGADTKKLKSKKLVEENRRASIAALEANRTTTDNPTAHLDLKAQRRPSDSGTIVKQPVEMKSNFQTKTENSIGKKGETSNINASDVGSSILLSIKENVLITKIIEKPEISSQIKTEAPLMNELSDDVLSKLNQPSKEESITSNINNKNEISTKQEIQIQSQDTKVKKDNKENNAPSIKPELNTCQTDFLVIPSESIAIEPIENSQTPTLDTIVANNDINHPCNDAEKPDASHIKETDVAFETTTAQTTNCSPVVNEAKASSSVEDSAKNTSNVSVVPVSIKTANDGTESLKSLSTGDDRVENQTDLANQEIVSAESNIKSVPSQTKTEVPVSPPKKKKKAKRKVVIRRLKRKLSKEDTFIQTPEAAAELEICEKEIEEKDEEQEPEEVIIPKERKPCIKARQFEIGDIVMYAERYKKTQVKWRKGIVMERITSISYKLNIDGEEKPAHISYIKKFTDRKVMFGGKEYLEIDYAQIEEDEEQERNYSIWNLV